MFNLKFIKMKAKILSFLFILSAALLISTSAYAAGNAAPSPGQTSTYSVTAGFASYKWKVLQSDGVTPAVGSQYSWTEGSTATQDIKWLATSAGNSYKIWVQATDANGCKTDPKMFDVTVTNTQFCIAPDATVVGAVTPAAPDNTTQCSLLTTGTTGTDGTLGDQTTFFATITGGVPSLGAGSAYTATYTISDGTNTSTVTSPANLITDATGAGALSITVKATDYVNQFTAASSAKTVTITVTKVTYDGVDVTNNCAGNHYDVAVHKLPTIAF
jgi:hypothetical protein